MIVDTVGNLSLKHTFFGTDYGGWAIDTSKISEDSVIYSFGVGTDISFDLELINKFQVRVFAFDPTPRCLDWISTQNLNENFIFHPVGISDFDGKSFFNFPPNDIWVSFSETKTTSENSVACEVKTLKSIMSLFNHTEIDILKMDIEGSEYHVIPNIINNNIYPKQILVEFHGDNTKKINEILQFMSMYDVFKRQDRHDYYLIHK